MPTCTSCNNQPLETRPIFGGAMMCLCDPPGTRKCVGTGERSSTAQKVCNACSKHYGICQECGANFTDDNPKVQNK